MSRQTGFSPLLRALCFASILAGCDSKTAEVVVPPPAALTVSQPARERVSDYIEFTGTTSAINSVDIRARVMGFLQKIDFQDGAMVKQGQLLFEIEPDVFRAEVDKAKANLQAAQARYEKAKADLAIKQQMFAGNAASKLDVIQAQANVSVAAADIASGNAQLEQANINLGFTKVYSPINGRIDRSRVDAGNLVGVDGNTLLANVVQADPIYVYFDAAESTVQRFGARAIAQGRKPGEATYDVPLVLALGDNTDFPFKGKIDYLDNKIDPSTGTLRVRGILPNADRAIVPGYFARIRVPDGEPYDALLIPDRAIGVDQGQKFLLVVNDKNVVEFRPIETGSQHGRMRVVKSGLSPDDWVIVDGILRTRPGATVAPVRKPLVAPDNEQLTPATAPSKS